MTNEGLLRRTIDNCGYKLKFVAMRAGLSYQGLLNKMQNKRNFTAPEIQAISELLNLTEAERTAIFFAPNVD